MTCHFHMDWNASLWVILPQADLKILEVNINLQYI